MDVEVFHAIIHNTSQGSAVVYANGKMYTKLSWYLFVLISM